MIQFVISSRSPTQSFGMDVFLTSCASTLCFSSGEGSDSDSDSDFLKSWSLGGWGLQSVALAAYVWTCRASEGLRVLWKSRLATPGLLEVQGRAERQWGAMGMVAMDRQLFLRAWGHIASEVTSAFSDLMQTAFSKRSPNFSHFLVSGGDFTLDWLLHSETKIQHVHIYGTPAIRQIRNRESYKERKERENKRDRRVGNVPVLSRLGSVGGERRPFFPYSGSSCGASLFGRTSSGTSKHTRCLLVPILCLATLKTHTKQNYSLKRWSEFTQK